MKLHEWMKMTVKKMCNNVISSDFFHSLFFLRNSLPLNIVHSKRTLLPSFAFYLMNVHTVIIFFCLSFVCVCVLAINGAKCRNYYSFFPPYPPPPPQSIKHCWFSLARNITFLIWIAEQHFYLLSLEGHLKAEHTYTFPVYSSHSPFSLLLIRHFWVFAYCRLVVVVVAVVVDVTVVVLFSYTSAPILISPQKHMFYCITNMQCTI